MVIVRWVTRGHANDLSGSRVGTALEILIREADVSLKDGARVEDVEVRGGIRGDGQQATSGTRGGEAEAETDGYEAKGREETLVGAEVCQASQRGQKTLSSPEDARATIALGHWQVGQLA